MIPVLVASLAVNALLAVLLVVHDRERRAERGQYAEIIDQQHRTLLARSAPERALLDRSGSSVVARRPAPKQSDDDAPPKRDPMREVFDAIGGAVA